MIHFLQIFVSVVFFSNKVLVLIGKKTGWLLGAIAAIAGSYYFFLLGLYIYTVLEIGLIVLMGYGYLIRNKSKKIENFLYFTITAVMVLLIYFSFSERLTIYEFVSSAGLLFGTYFLTHEKKEFGWILYCISHLFAMYIGYIKNQIFFADFQLASAIVSVIGVFIAHKQLRETK